ncbi:MAG: putative ABC transporter permease subunit [Halothermotrichaceae bacterium]
MNNLKSLILIQVKDLLGRSKSGLNVKNDKLAKLLQLFIVAALATPAINFSFLTFKTFEKMGQPELVITSMYVNSVILMFVLGIPFIVSTFFFSKDINFLSSLPVREDVIVFSKLSSVYLYLLGLTILLVAPAVVIYGINSGFTSVFIIMSVFALLLAPVIPLLISAILVIILSRFLMKPGRKNIFITLGNVLLLGVIIMIQMMITRYVSSPEYLRSALANNKGLMALVGMSFPPSIWMTRMLTGSIKNTVYFLAVNLGLILLLQRLAGIFYKRALTAYGESSTSSGEVYYVKHSQKWQILKRHIMIILKQPMFMMNSVLSLFVPILMFVIMSFSGQFSLELLRSPELRPYLILIFTGIITSPAIIGNISSTAITREGRSFWETLVIPISARDNIRYRVLTTLIFSFTGTVIMGIISLFLLPLTISDIVLGTFVAVAVTLFFAHIDIIINIYRPLLNWTNPTAAVKNNLNVTISLGLRAVSAGLLYVLYRLYHKNAAVNIDIMLTAAGIIFLGLYLGTRYILYNKYVERFKQISL